MSAAAFVSNYDEPGRVYVAVLAVVQKLAKFNNLWS